MGGSQTEALHRLYLAPQNPKWTRKGIAPTAHFNPVVELCRPVDSCYHNNMAAEFAFTERPDVRSSSSGENDTTFSGHEAQVEDYLVTEIGRH